MQKPEQDPLRLVKYVGKGALEGAAAGWVILLILKYMNIAGIGDLIRNSSEGWLMYALGFVFFGITFGMLGIAWRVMVLLPDEDD